MKIEIKKLHICSTWRRRLTKLYGTNVIKMSFGNLKKGAKFIINKSTFRTHYFWSQIGDLAYYENRRKAGRYAWGIYSRVNELSIKLPTDFQLKKFVKLYNTGK